MTKLLNAYRAAPTFKNAQKIRAHDCKHPFAVTCLTREDTDLVTIAIHHANKEEAA